MKADTAAAWKGASTRKDSGETSTARPTTEEEEEDELKERGQDDEDEGALGVVEEDDDDDDTAVEVEADAAVGEGVFWSVGVVLEEDVLLFLASTALLLLFSILALCSSVRGISAGSRCTCLTT